MNLILVGSVHFVNCGVVPWWDPSTLWICISLTLVGSVHFMVIILVVRTQHGLECFFIRFKAVEKSTCPLGLKKVLKK